jgi:hypothetical protein
MSDFFHVQVDAFGCALALSSSCIEGQDLLERYVLAALQGAATSTAAPDLEIGIGQDGEGFFLSAGGATVASASRATDLVPELIQRLDDSVVHRLRGLCAVHAGVVQVGDEAILLPGMTHAGKSSLVAALLERGATYFSDEYALIDTEGKVHPYPRPLLVRNGMPGQTARLAEEYGARTGREAVRLGWILALEYRPQEGWRVQPIPQSGGVLLLLANTPHVLAESPKLIEVFQYAVAGARCWQGFRGDAAEAAEEILRMVQGEQARPEGNAGGPAGVMQ